IRRYPAWRVRPMARLRTTRQSSWGAEHHRAWRKPIRRRPRRRNGGGTRSFRFLPEFHQRPAGAIDRILARRRYLRDRFERTRAVFGSRALVIGAGRRIGAHDQEIVVRRQALMTRTGRQDRDVSCLQREYPALVPTEADAALTARDAQHFMNP